jgi:hypothetical protein
MTWEGDRRMPQSARIAFAKMDEVVFGKPAAQAMVDQARLAAYPFDAKLS